MFQRRCSLKTYNSIKELFKKEQYSRALFEIEKYLKEYPNDEFAQYLHGKILIKANDTEEAKLVFKDIINKNTIKKDFASIELAKIYLEEDEEYAILLLKKVINNNPSLRSLALRLLFDVKINQYKLNDANNILKKIKNKDDNYHLCKAKLYVLMGQKEKANLELSNINIKKLNRESLLYLMEIEVANEHFNKALEISKYLTTIHDEIYTLTLLEKSRIYNMIGKYGAALDICNELILECRIDDSKEIFISKGIAYQHLSDYQKAEECFLEALKSNKKRVKNTAKWRLAYLLHENKQFTEAKEIYKELLNHQFKNNFRLYLNLISILISERNYCEAEKVLEKMQKNCPNKEKYQDKYQYLKILLQKYQQKTISLKKSNRYLESQILNFSEEKSKDHIIRHRKKKSSFNKNINFEDLYQYTMNNLIEENRVYGDILDVYEIDYQNIGDGIDKYRVIVLPETKNIITMFPHKDNKFNRIKDFIKVKEKEKKFQEERRKKVYSKFNLN